MSLWPNFWTYITFFSKNIKTLHSGLKLPKPLNWWCKSRKTIHWTQGVNMRCKYNLCILHSTSKTWFFVKPLTTLNAESTTFVSGLSGSNKYLAAWEASEGFSTPSSSFWNLNLNSVLFEQSRILLKCHLRALYMQRMVHTPIVKWFLPSTEVRVARKKKNLPFSIIHSFVHFPLALLLHSGSWWAWSLSLLSPGECWTNSLDQSWVYCTSCPVKDQQEFTLKLKD